MTKLFKNRSADTAAEHSIKEHKYMHPFTLIFAIVVVAAIMTWIIPSGQFDRVLDDATGREISVAGTYHAVDPNHIDPSEMIKIVVNSIVGAGDLVIFILVIGGAFGILSSTGALTALMARMIRAFHGKPYSRFLFPALMLFIFACSSTFGMAEEAIVFTPLVVAAAIALGYDAVVAVATMVFSIALGFAAATTNPYNIGIAQSIAGLPMYSGLWFRAIIFVVIFAIAAWYLLRYAKRIKKDPSRSLLADFDYSDYSIQDPASVELTAKHKRVLIVFGILFAFMIFAVVKWAWWLDNLTALFLVIALLVGLANGYGFSKIAEQFVEGGKTLLMAALLVGFARTIGGVLSEGLILDTIIYGITIPLSTLPNILVGPVMVLVQSLINIVIPSASAMAVVTMPIMIPLADILEVQRQTAVIAFQFGDGITNMVMPYYSILVIALGLSRVPFRVWFKFALPLVGILLLVACIMTGLAEFIQVGPF